MVPLGMSDIIARFILDTMEQYNGIAELQRSELAERFHCVPSQINYVISTRFSPEHGYIVESRRGGGGYIRISRVEAPEKQLVMHMINAAGDELDASTAAAFVSNAFNNKLISRRDAKLILAALGDSALKTIPSELRDLARASIFKQIMIHLIS
jgi:transcriptional regulator CtsR